MRGRPKTPTKLKELNGNRDKRWLVENEMSFALNTEIPNAPDHVRFEAVEIFETVCRELKSIGMLVAVDTEMIAAYSEAMATYKNASRKLVEQGDVIPGLHGNVINPFFAIRERSLKQAKEIGLLFGITPSARAKISNTPAQTESKLDKFKKSKTA